MDRNCNMQYYYLNKKIALEIIVKFPKLPTKICSPGELQEAVCVFDKTSACSGGPCIEDFKNVFPQCASHDVLGKWRHIDCEVLLENKTSKCRKCFRLRHTLNVNKLRNKKPLKRLRLKSPISPLKMCAFEKLKKARHAQSKVLSKAKIKINTLRSTLKVIQKRYLNLLES